MTVSSETVHSISSPDRLGALEFEDFFAILRIYSPLQSYFDKSWRPSEIEVVS